MNIGVLMLDTAFDRLPGDIGHPASWPFELTYEIIDGATPKTVVTPTDPHPLTPFLRGADVLMQQGVAGITTTCGFLGIYQHDLAAYCSVPVATSALLQYPMIRAQLRPDQTVGILTFNREALSDALLQQTGCEVAAPIKGFETSSAFHQWIMYGDNQITPATLETDVRRAARELVTAHPSVGAILCECTNLSSFRQSIASETSRPVYDMTTLLHWFHAGLNPTQPHTRR